MEPGYSEILDELKQIRFVLLVQIRDAQVDTKLHRRELRTSQAALKSIEDLLAAMEQGVA